jgi:lysophospholipase L1-like esterase
MENTLNLQWVKLVQFQHPEKMLSFIRNMDESLIAALYGMDVVSYQLTKKQLQLQAQDAAKELLEDPAFADRVDQLPFKQGETIIGVGESTTDDLLSWLEILRHLLDLRRPNDGIAIINEGISGHTSTQVLGRFTGIMSRQPNWIICMIGSNDVLRVGPVPTKTQVSPEETSKNLAAIRHIAAQQTKTSWIWITPPTFDEIKIGQNPYFKQRELVWRNDDILVIGDIIRKQPEMVVDTQSGFGVPASAEFVGPDGIHPSIAGQQAIVKWLVEEITGGKSE